MFRRGTWKHKYLIKSSVAHLRLWTKAHWRGLIYSQNRCTHAGFASDIHATRTTTVFRRSSPCSSLSSLRFRSSEIDLIAGKMSSTSAFPSRLTGIILNNIGTFRGGAAAPELGLIGLAPAKRSAAYFVEFSGWLARSRTLISKGVTHSLTSSLCISLSVIFMTRSRAAGGFPESVPLQWCLCSFLKSEPVNCMLNPHWDTNQTHGSIF